VFWEKWPGNCPGGGGRLRKCGSVGCTRKPQRTPGVGSALGDHIGRKDIEIPIRSCVDGFPLDKAVVVDFTAPPGRQATCALLDALKGPCAGLVIGTTGLRRRADRTPDPGGFEEIRIVFSPNMSVGVNLLFI